MYLSILGISWFWLYGALFLSQFPDYAKTVLVGGETSVSALLAIFSVGIGVGSLLCERLSGHKVEIGLVPFGSIGLTLFGVDLYFASQSLPGGALVSAWTLFSGPYLRVVVDLFLMGAFGGFYIVPLYALIQSRTEKSHVSRVVAGNNILNAVFMVAGAGIAIALIKAGFTVTEILLAAALMNAVVAAYIYTLVPEFLMRFMVWMLIHSVYRLEKAGLERIPDDGPAILVCNHVSYVDALVISAACRRPIRWVMDHRIFAVPLLSFFFRTVRAIPIAPAREDARLLERAYNDIAGALADGELVGIFPEGRLTANGEMGDFRSGIRQALDRTPVPVVPMALSGLWQSLFARNPGKVQEAEGSLSEDQARGRRAGRGRRGDAGAPARDRAGAARRVAVSVERNRSRAQMSANADHGNPESSAMLERLGRLLFSFRGRLPRATFWWTALLTSAAFVALLVALEATFGERASLILYPPFFWIVAALAVRRLRDRGRHPLWLGVLLVPIVGPLWALVELGFRRGTPGENRYGQDPLEIRGDYLTVK